MAKISVIVPVYKVEPYLHRCVDSILAQTFSDFELILVDDGSPDNCPAICDEYAKKDDRVVVIHQENGGLSAARNAGIDWAFANSNSEWITFIDSDDWVHHDMLEKLYNAVIKYNVSICFGGCLLTKDYGQLVAPCIENNCLIFSPEERFVSPIDSLFDAHIACAKLYCKESFKDIRFPVGKIHEDEFIIFKIIFAVSKLAYVPSALYYYYFNPNGISKSEWSIKKLDALEAFQAQIYFFKNHNFMRAFKKSVYALLTSIEKNIHQITISNIEPKQKKELIRALDKTRKKTIKSNKKFFDFKVDKAFYEMAYPNLMSLCWIYKGFYNKIKTILKV